jgi:carbonic anhydrase
VIQQVLNVGNTTVLQEAWQRGQKVAVHGWIYCLCDGLLKDLDVSISSNAELKSREDRGK